MERRKRRGYVPAAPATRQQHPGALRRHAARQRRGQRVKEKRVVVLRLLSEKLFDRQEDSSCRFVLTIEKPHEKSTESLLLLSNKRKATVASSELTKKK
jgi:hypothetical protein